MPDETAIEAWIEARVTARRGSEGAPFNRGACLVKLGLPPRDLVALSGELQDWLGVPVCPVIAWEFPTIAELARHLASLTR